MLTRTQRDQVLKWFRDEKLTVADALKRAEGLGWDLKRAAAYNLRLQALGEAGDRPSDQLRRAVEGAEVQEAAAGAAAAPEDVAELTSDELAALAAGPIEQLEMMRRRLVRLGAAATDPKIAVNVASCLCSLTMRVAELQDRAGTAERPRSLIFLPVRRPDPAVYDPGDPASWPNNPYTRPPYAPDPSRYPPDQPAIWPDNPYALYPYRPYSCVCWGSQIWEPAPPAQLQDGPVPLTLRTTVVEWLRTLAHADLARAPREVLQALESA